MSFVALGHEFEEPKLPVGELRVSHPPRIPRDGLVPGVGTFLTRQEHSLDRDVASSKVHRRRGVSQQVGRPRRVAFLREVAAESQKRSTGTWDHRQRCAANGQRLGSGVFEDHQRRGSTVADDATAAESVDRPVKRGKDPRPELAQRPRAHHPARDANAARRACRPAHCRFERSELTRRDQAGLRPG